MPSGWERINAKKSAPNKNIAFIKPLPGPHEATSKDYLGRIAAQCLPIMNKQYLSVVSLEEYEPNVEFWGRNFNNGEVIQLVLRSPSSGRWLPFRFVQMVMMHELAHCKQMNHSKAFWAVRNEYVADMKILWGRNYTGDGLWGHGVLLENGAFTREALDEGELLPEHMCGGTFSTRGRKRKVRPKITYKERRERRIKKRFGMNGMALGADDAVKAKLEKGSKPTGKPRVAGSVRGRELRAAAALARFETKEQDFKDEELVTDSENESEADDEMPLEKICESEDREDPDAKNEFKELKDMSRDNNNSQIKLQHEEGDFEKFKPTSQKLPSVLGKQLLSVQQVKRNSSASIEPLEEEQQAPETQNRRDQKTWQGEESFDVALTSCPICSVSNDGAALTCNVCSHVLKTEFVPDCWRCQSATCKESIYINSGDVGLCGLCGSRRCYK